MAEHDPPGALAGYRQLLAAQVRSQLQYRVSFVMDILGNLVLTLVDVATVVVLFRVTPVLGGFSLPEALLISGLANLSFALCDLSVGNIDTMRLYIRTGRFDAVLARPLSVLLQLICGDLALRRFGRVAQGVVVLVIALNLVPVRWTFARAALLVLAPLFGAVLFASIFVAGSTVAFWFIESGEFANSFTYGGRDFSAYPATVYAGWFRKAFAYGLGFAFVAYYPALAILGKPDPLGGPRLLSWSSPVVALAAAGVAALIWRTGIRHYRSTGS
ncbi:ABC transporter permease [Rugosimonospora acidiphila]|uniref:ABC transporter permease n=1 Tax=Rugosimonospora acidiphila TaxID=556531 RepID=A0ABP9S4M1_9ACTN